METDLDEVMRKYDRESATRIWEGTPKIIITVIMTLFSLYCLYMTLFSTALPEVRLTLFVGCIIILGFLTYPAKKGHVKVNSLPLYDIVLMLVGSACFFYFAINAFTLIQLATRIEPIHVIIGVIGILVLIELCRRCVGIPILCVVAALLIYTFYNQLSYNPSFFNALKNVVYKLFYTTSGVIGTPINVCFTYIVLFIIFGAFLERTGIASFFIDFANRVAGWSSGGPAKVAVISSALCGMVSGSSVGNTVTTGSVTIPMMKKTGYKPEFAGAVEAAASTGGQIMPPIMGAAAFLMAEYMDLPYAEVAVKAILPAILYFSGIFIAVHLEAKKLGLQGIPRTELPKWGYLLRNLYLILPLVLLVWLVSSGAKTMATSAAISILASFIIGFIHLLATNLRQMNGQGFGKILWLTVKASLLSAIDALAAGAKGAITVAVACAMAGMIAGCITVTGLASILINAIVQLAGNATIIGLVLTMLCCIVLGMGVPTTANYCIMASTCAPILIQLGFSPVAAHFFVFYFGIVADITPPVALAAYAGSAIAKSNPMKTGINATKLAIAAFIVPYIFAYNPSMLFVGNVEWYDVLLISVTALLGLFGIAAALNGHLFRKIPMVLRLALVAGGLGMMIPGLTSDLIGLAVVAAVVVFQYISGKKQAASAA
ncbi:MAG: TRAP transporter fused permease subunit [Firmicutes bacterium]|nr:TRAP transporter fused permease subunit [Bacillota bacterium]